MTLSILEKAFIEYDTLCSVFDTFAILEPVDHLSFIELVLVTPFDGINVRETRIFSIFEVAPLFSLDAVPVIDVFHYTVAVCCVISPLAEVSLNNFTFIVPKRL